MQRKDSYSLWHTDYWELPLRPEQADFKLIIRGVHSAAVKQWRVKNGDTTMTKVVRRKHILDTGWFICVLDIEPFKKWMFRKKKLKHVRFEDITFSEYVTETKIWWILSWLRHYFPRIVKFFLNLLTLLAVKYWTINSHQLFNLTYNSIDSSLHTLLKKKLEKMKFLPKLPHTKKIWTDLWVIVRSCFQN